MKLYAIFDKDGNVVTGMYSDEEQAWSVTWFKASASNENLGRFKSRMKAEGYTCEEVEIVRVKK